MDENITSLIKIEKNQLYLPTVKFNFMENPLSKMSLHQRKESAYQNSYNILKRNKGVFPLNPNQCAESNVPVENINLDEPCKKEIIFTILDYLVHTFCLKSSIAQMYTQGKKTIDEKLDVIYLLKKLDSIDYLQKTIDKLNRNFYSEMLIRNFKYF
jgi:hypothetical protein